MAKKNFKKSARDSVAAAFFSEAPENNSKDVLSALDISNTNNTQDNKGALDTIGASGTLSVQRVSDTQSAKSVLNTETEVATYRLNLKLKGEYKEYLSEMAWRNRTSITAYLNDLIEEDFRKNKF